MKYIIVILSLWSFAINAQIDTTDSIMFTDKYIAENNYKVVDTVGDMLHTSGKQMKTGLVLQILSGIAAVGLSQTDLDDSIKIGAPALISGIGVALQLTGASNISLSGKKIRELEFKNE